MSAEEQQQACMESKKSHGRNPSPLLHHHHHHHPLALLSFFKVMIGDFSQALFLPPIVAKKLSALLNQNVDIEDTNGHRWGVRVSLVDNHLAFEQGWQDFVLDHSIKVGEFVVFNHVDRMLFSAKIYAISGCERLGFIEKSIAGKSKGKRKNEASTDDLSLKKCQPVAVGKLDKDVVDSNEGSIKIKQTTKSSPCGTSDSQMVTRSRKAGRKRKGEDVNVVRTSRVRRESSKRLQIDIVEPVVLLDEMVDRTCQISPAGPVNMDMDVMTITDCDNSNNVGDSISEGMGRDFVMEELMPDVKPAQVPVKVTSRDSVFMKGNITVSSPDMIASETNQKSCGAVETNTLVTNEQSLHGSLSETEAEHVAIVDPLVMTVLTGESPQGVIAVSSVNSTPTETIGNTCDVRQTTDEFMRNEERKCTGDDTRNDTEAYCETAVDPLISNTVITEDLPQGTSAAEGIKIKLEGGETDPSASFVDDDVIERNLNASDGLVYKFLGTLQGICYIVEEDFTDKFGRVFINPTDMHDVDEADILHNSDGAFNDDWSRSISPPVLLDKVPQKGELGSLGKMSAVSLEENEKYLNPSSEITAREDVKPECLTIGKKPDELLEENEKKSSLSPEATLHEDLRPAPMDLLELPSSSSFIFKFRLPSNDNSWLKLPNSIPYSFGKMFLLRKVLVLQDPVMRKWPVLYCESRRFTGFIGGWKDFTAANDLKEGDTCELYLADKKSHTFLVRIKKAENPAP